MKARNATLIEGRFCAHMVEGAVECFRRASFNRFKNEGHGGRASYVRGRWFEQHRCIRLPLLKLS